MARKGQQTDKITLEKGISLKLAAKKPVYE